MDKNNNEDWCSKDKIDRIIQETNCSVDEAKEVLLLFKNGNVTDSINFIKYDIKSVMESTNCSLETAKKTLFNNDGDVVNSILEIIESQGLNILDIKEICKSYPTPTNFQYYDPTNINNCGIKRKFDELSNVNNDEPKVNEDKKSKGALQKLVDFNG